MPTIFEQDGYKFFFYSNEHEPIHVHVRHGGGEAVFEVGKYIELRESQNMKMNELRKALELAQKNHELIVEKWHVYFD